MVMTLQLPNHVLSKQLFLNFFFGRGEGDRSRSLLLHVGFLELVSGGYSLILVQGLLTVLASLVVEHGFRVCGLQ